MLPFQYCRRFNTICSDANNLLTLQRNQIKCFTSLYINLMETRKFKNIDSFLQSESLTREDLKDMMLQALLLDQESGEDSNVIKQPLYYLHRIITEVE